MFLLRWPKFYCILARFVLNIKVYNAADMKYVNMLNVSMWILVDDQLYIHIEPDVMVLTYKKLNLYSIHKFNNFSNMSSIFVSTAAVAICRNSKIFCVLKTFVVKFFKSTGKYFYKIAPTIEWSFFLRTSNQPYNNQKKFVHNSLRSIFHVIKYYQSA